MNSTGMQSLTGESAQNVGWESAGFEGSKIVGVSGAFYTDRGRRFELALETAETYRNAGLPYVVVDASPNDWVASAHRERGAFVLRAGTPGIATQRQQGVGYAVAHGAEKMASHEPEKTLMPTFADEISGALDRADVLVIGRTDAAERTLPPVQRRTERLAGWILEQAHGLPHDTLSGGRGFTIAGANVFAEYPANMAGMNNWIYLYDTPIEARKRGLRIGGIDIDLVHPTAMVDEETGNPAFDKKRFDQFKLQLDYLLGRPDVRPEAAGLAEFVLGVLARPEALGALDEQYALIAEIEQRAAKSGYLLAS